MKAKKGQENDKPHHIVVYSNYARDIPYLMFITSIENESFSQYFDSLSPVSNKLSPGQNRSNYKFTEIQRYCRYASLIMENDDEDDNRSDSDISKKCNFKVPSDHRIKHNQTFYYCIVHPEFKNVNLEKIGHHLLYH